MSHNATLRTTNEESPLLGRPTGGKSDGDSPLSAKRLKKHFVADVTKNWADLVLLYCYIIVGLLDSSAVFIWGSFVSMQTGTYRRSFSKIPVKLLFPLDGTKSTKQNKTCSRKSK